MEKNNGYCLEGLQGILPTYLCVCSLFLYEYSSENLVCDENSIAS